MKLTDGLLNKEGESDSMPAKLSGSRIRINLLPHRERRRERLRKDFVIVMAVVSVLACTLVFAGGVLINRSIDAQQERNRFIEEKNAELDQKIAQIKTLRDEIAALRARQKAVEDLQSDRTVPVHLFDELARIVPENVVLMHVKQEDKKLNLVGFAQSNERVAELLHSLAERSPWLERPELSEIKEAVATAVTGARESRKIYEFSLNVLIKQPAERSGEKIESVKPPEPAAVGPRFIR